MVFIACRLFCNAAGRGKATVKNLSQLQSRPCEPLQTRQRFNFIGAFRAVALSRRRNTMNIKRPRLAPPSGCYSTVVDVPPGAGTCRNSTLDRMLLAIRLAAASGTFRM
jgi:hypothetical protein